MFYSTPLERFILSAMFWVLIAAFGLYVFSGLVAFFQVVLYG